MSLGAQKAGFQHVFAIDNNEDAIETYKSNIKGHHDFTFCMDLDDEVARNEAFESIHRLNPSIDCIAFGFPCNSFSSVSTQEGIADGKFGHLYKHALEAVCKFNAKVFIAENVEGIFSANNGEDCHTIVNRMRYPGGLFMENGVSESGKHRGKRKHNRHKYEVFCWVLNAADYGVPQTRKRAIFMGIRDDIFAEFLDDNGISDLDADTLVPLPTTPGSSNWVTAGKALKDIPDWAANNEKTELRGAALERLKYIKPRENAFTADIPPELRLNVNGAKISQIYRRLDKNRPAYTVTAAGGGGTHMYHWKEHRALTNRERARLQGFPDTFEFIGNYNSVRKQVGMALPPPLARAIFREAYEILELARKK